MIRVLHLIDGFALGGAQTVLLELVRRFDPSLFSLEVAGLHGGGPFRETLRQNGVPVHVLSEEKWPPNYLVSLPKLLCSQSYDIIHCHLFAANWLGKPLAALLSPLSVLISHDHCNDSLRWKDRSALLLDSLTNRCSDQVIAVSRSTADFLLRFEAMDPDKVCVIPNGVDTQVFVPPDSHARLQARRHLGWPETGPIVLGAGRLVEQKNFQGFLRVARQCATSGSPARFVIAGEGPQLQELVGLTADLGLTDRVLFAGFVSDRLAMLQAADLLFLPSLYEGLPMILLEAMACGLPVVASRVDGIAEILSHESAALLRAPGDEGGFARDLSFLLASERERIQRGASLRALASQHFDSSMQVHKLQELYRILLARKPGRPESSSSQYLPSTMASHSHD
jgi:glycosyltransferase involved in cell wall biosynthesis